MEHTLYQRQRGAAQKNGKAAIQYKIRKTLYGIKIRKVEGSNQRWLWESVGTISASHTVSKL